MGYRLSDMSRDTDTKLQRLADWRPNKVGATLFIIILLIFTISLQAKDNILDGHITDCDRRIDDLKPAHLIRQDYVRRGDIPMLLNNGSDPAYCWTEFMGDDGLGFGARVWNFHVSELSDCDILKQECLHFKNVSETFDCSWQDNTCTCRLREHCDDSADAEISIKTSDDI